MYLYPTLTARQSSFDCNVGFFGGFGSCSNSSWNTWGRWVFLGGLIAAFLVLMLLMRFYSARRVKAGRKPVAGTAWMVPPSYYQSQQQYQEPPVPVYNAQLGHADAGYYDRNGNFIQRAPDAEGAMPPVNPDVYQPPPMPPPGHEITEQQEGYEMNSYGDHKTALPPAPEQAHTYEYAQASSSHYAPPPGPPPSH